MESALYGILTLVGEVSEISLVRCAHSFDFRYFTNSCENPVRARFPWSNLYLISSLLFFADKTLFFAHQCCFGPVYTSCECSINIIAEITFSIDQGHFVLSLFSDLYKSP